MFKKLFLPVGLLIAAAIAWVFPAPGVWLKARSAVPLLVVAIFLVNGWQVKLAGSRLGRSFVVAFVIACLLSLGAAPILGTLATRLLPMSAAISAGLIVMSSVPVTLSSATVMTEVSGGNRAWALLMTIAMNVAGILTIPVMVGLCLGGEEVRVPVAKLFGKLLLLVLLPFLVGHIARRITHRGSHPFLSYIPSFCVIMTVYVAFAASRSKLVGINPAELPVVVFAVLGLHLLLMGVTFCTSVLLRLHPPERKALCFVSSQKTLPIAISVLTALALDTALALIPCLLFHFGQLIVDSGIAAVWNRSQDSSDSKQIC